jgi:broad-specificity NMP kinase
MIAHSHERRLPRLVELAGPAGVGKSTVSRALRRRFTAAPGTIWGLPVLPLLGNGMELVPTLAGLWLHSRSLLWDESRHMVRLRTLHRGLSRGDFSNREVLIFDEGPVFALAWLRGFGHETMRSAASDAWWEATLSQWARTVSVIVVLDAPDFVLASRIRARPEWHEVKQASDPEISVWMARFRSALSWVLVGLAVEGGPLVVRIPTDQDQPERIAERVVTALDRVAYDH